MSDLTLVTFGSIQNAQADVTATAAAIDQQMTDLKQYLAPMIATWTGTAATDYQALQNQWNTATEDLNAVLRQIAVNLGNANDNYTSTESGNARVWGS